MAEANGDWEVVLVEEPEYPGAYAGVEAGADPCDDEEGANEDASFGGRKLSAWEKFGIELIPALDDDWGGLEL